MNELSKCAAAPFAEDIGKNRRISLAALGSIDGLGDAMVPAGILPRLAHDLDHPAWMFDGTGLDPQVPFPIKIRLADDLVMVANLLDRFGPLPLLSSVLTDFDSTVNHKTLGVLAAAPDLAALLQYLTKSLNIQNPHLKVLLSESRAGHLIEVTAMSELADVGLFLEHLVAAAIVRLTGLFQPKMRKIANGKSSWPVLRLRDAADDTVAALAAIGQVDVAASEGSTTLFVSSTGLPAQDPRHDPDLWSLAYQALRKNWTQDHSPFSVASLRLHIRQSLKTSQRAPGLNQLASDMAMSPRTIGRKLASLDISFQQMVSEEKMAIARESLTDPRWSVDRVAGLLGYSNSASFGRAFRQMHGISPSEWRERLR